MLSKLQSLLQWNFSPLLVNSLIKTSICFWVLKGYELLLKVGMSARSLSSRPPDSSFWGIWSCVLLGFHESPLFFYTIFRYPVNSFVDFWGFPLLICLEYVFFFHILTLLFYWVTWRQLAVHHISQLNHLAITHYFI